MFAVLLALPALSQQISVESFTPLENDLTANTAGTMKKDQNGKTCALIKVVTSEKGFNFDVGILGVVATEQKVGEIWVYVPEKDKVHYDCASTIGCSPQLSYPSAS